MDLESQFSPDPYALLRRSQGLPYTDMRYGFKGRDAFKQLKKDVYNAQFYEPLEDSPL